MRTPLVAGLAVLCAPCSLTGCTTKSVHAYDGDPRPTSELARIRGHDGSFAGGARTALIQVDAFAVAKEGSEHTAWVLPGRHVAEVEALWFQYQSGQIVAGLFGADVSGPPLRRHRKADISFEVEAGHSYAIRTDKTLRIWVEDQGTRATVPSHVVRNGPACLDHVDQFNQYDCWWPDRPG